MPGFFRALLDDTKSFFRALLDYTENFLEVLFSGETRVGSMTRLYVQPILRAAYMCQMRQPLIQELHQTVHRGKRYIEFHLAERAEPSIHVSIAQFNLPWEITDTELGELGAQINQVLADS